MSAHKLTDEHHHILDQVRGSGRSGQRQAELLQLVCGDYKLLRQLLDELVESGQLELTGGCSMPRYVVPETRGE